MAVMLSIVIPTYKPRALHRVLGGLDMQTNRSFEVIVVENGTADSSLADLVDSFRQRLAVVHLRLPEPGLNRARNYGVGHARYETIALLDDDCIPAPVWAENLLHARGEYPQAGVIGGRVTLGFDSDPPRWLHGEFRRSLAELERGEGCRPLGRWEHLVGANLSFSLRTFRQVGGFQIHLGLSGKDALLRANDEAEFILQASTIGTPGAVYAGDMHVEHLIPDWRISFDYMLERRFGQGVSDIEQELFILGAEAAGQRLTSMVLRSRWHRDEHDSYTAGMTDAEAADFTLKVMLSRVVYLIGARERFFHPQPVVRRLTLAGALDQAAYRRGQRWVRGVDAGSAAGIDRLRQVLYARRPRSNPFRAVCLIAGAFEGLLGLESHFPNVSGEAVA